MKIIKFIFAVIVTAALIIVGVTLGGPIAEIFASTSAASEAGVHDDLDKLSKSHGSATYISKFDLICFGVNNSAFRQELLLESKRLGRKFDMSMRSCGLDNSCCSVSSDASGIVGLIEGNEVRCVEIYRFDYWTKDNQPTCAAPGNLIVEPITEPPPRMPGRPQFRASRPSYYVRERAQ